MSAAPGTVRLGAIIAGGFGVLRARPGAVIVWALIYLAIIASLAYAVRSGLPVQPEPSGDPRVLATAMGTSLLLGLTNLAAYIILLTAAMRSVLRPSGSGIAFLRIGPDEFRQIALILFYLILFYVGLIIAGIVLAVITALFIAAAGTGPAMIAAFAVDGALVLILASWLSVRLSLSFPLTLLRGKFTISESWRLTRGRFWTLFGGFFLIYLFVLLLSVGAASVTMSDYFSDLARGGFTMQSVQEAARAQQARQMGPIGSTMVVGWLAAAIAAALGVALQGGALATAARALADVRGEMAETFA